MTQHGPRFKLFSHVPAAPPDPIFNLTAQFREDSSANKVNVGVGAYRSDKEMPWVLPTVKKAELLVVNDDSLDHEYLPIDGDPEFIKASLALVYGSNAEALASQRIAGFQSISGTGALRIGAEFLKRYFPESTVYIPNPTWISHRTIFTDAGMKIAEYPYYDKKSNTLLFSELIKLIQNVSPKSVFILHACAHNPTGMDPTPAQWKELAELMKERDIIPFFDCAYQGFASGDLDKDAFPIRLYEKEKFEFLVAQSYSKNFGLYNERVGCLSIVCSDSDSKSRVTSQVKKIIRSMISNPPAFGARIVTTILKSPKLFESWMEELTIMVDRIKAMRHALFEELTKLGTPGDWTHIIKQIGMFSFTGLSEKQSRALREDFHIYLTDNGRLSMAGFTSRNVHYIAASMDRVVREIHG